jgi:hypothetical protein
MAWSMLALEHRAQVGHFDPRLVPGRVHLLRRRGEHGVHAGLPGEVEIAGLVPRVAVQVGGLAELGGVDEEAHHDRVARLAGRLEQGEVAAVERAHRRHEPDSPISEICERGAHVLHGPCDDHVRLPDGTVS